MPQSESTAVNPVQLHRPLCSKCGTLCALARIEPAPEPDHDHDLRTFECPACGNTHQVLVKFR